MSGGKIAQLKKLSLKDFCNILPYLSAEVFTYKAILELAELCEARYSVVDEMQESYSSIHEKAPPGFIPAQAKLAPSSEYQLDDFETPEVSQIPEVLKTGDMHYHIPEGFA